jgi:biopolymer transport protein ExbD
MSISAASGQEFQDINVTPLTDVFLVLLVIMILIAPLIDKSDLKIKPPETRNAKKDDANKCIDIDIDQEGQIAINSKFIPNSDPATIQSQIEQFQKRAGTKDVVCTLRADGNAKQKNVVAVMTAAAQAGIKRMRVATIQSGSY